MIHKLSRCDVFCNAQYRSDGYTLVEMVGLTNDKKKKHNIDCSIRALLVDLCWVGGPPGRIGASLFCW